MDPARAVCRIHGALSCLARPGNRRRAVTGSGRKLFLPGYFCVPLQYSYGTNVTRAGYRILRKRTGYASATTSAGTDVNGLNNAGRGISARAVCSAIRDDIISGFFPPGSRLTEELLAKRFGVSRVPVREALRTLESEGFVRTRRHAGASVAEPTEQEAADLVELRMLVEPLGAARAAQRRAAGHLKVLRGLVRLGQERAGQGRLGDLTALSGWFHETLAQASGNTSLTQLLTQLRYKIAWVYAEEVPQCARQSWDEHAAIVDAVARGDAERARRVCAAHVEGELVNFRLRRVHRPLRGDAGAVSWPCEKRNVQ